MATTVVIPGEDLINANLSSANSLGTSMNTAYVAVCTNSMPDHAYSAQDEAAQAPFFNLNPSQGFICFRVPFNVAPADLQNGAPNIVSSTTDITTLLCDNEVAASENMLYDLERNYNDVSLGMPLSDLSEYVGVTFNGVLIHTAFSDFGFDGISPKLWGTHKTFRNITLDQCLGTSYQLRGNVYHYQSFSPCIFTNQIQTQSGVCKNLTSCKKDPVQYAINGAYPSNNQRKLAPIGLARDGRVIYGPYKNDGSLWQPCEVDICNGVYLNGNYVYVSTTFFPYTVGCWGPAQMTSSQPSCTANPRVCKPAFSSGYMTIAKVFSLIALTLTFALF